mgnify:FL=1
MQWLKGVTIILLSAASLGNSVLNAIPANELVFIPPKQDFTILPPILRKIALCESGDRHFDRDGLVLRGEKNPNDIGRFQINLVHEAQAASLGLNLFIEEDNAKYALYLYETQGTRPWRYSQFCWNNEQI